MSKSKKQLIALISVLLVAALFIGLYLIIDKNNRDEKRRQELEASEAAEKGELYTLGDDTVEALKGLKTSVVFRFGEGEDTDDEYLSIIMRFAREYAALNDKIQIIYGDEAVKADSKDKICFSLSSGDKSQSFLRDDLFKALADGTKYAFDGERVFNAFIFEEEISSSLRALKGYDTDGDIVNAQGQPFMYPRITRNDVNLLRVRNQYETYTAFSLEGKFYFLGAERLDIDGDMFSQLIVDSTYTLAQYKIQNPGALSDYGLGSDEEAEAVVEVYTKDEKYHKILIGKRLANGSGYYAKYYNKDFVYVIDTTVEGAILQPLNNYLPAVLVYTVTSSGSDSSVALYTEVTDIRVNYLKENTNITIETLTEEEKSALSVNTIWKITSPADFIPEGREYASPNLSNVSDMLIKLTSLSSDNILEYDFSEEKLASNLEKYGLSSPAYELSYVYKGYRSTVYFSELDKNTDSYNVYSVIRSVSDENEFYYTGAIVSVSASDFEFLKWAPLKYRDSSLYMSYIYEVDKITAFSEGTEYVFKLGKDGKNISEVLLNSKPIDVLSFQYFYQSILLCSLTGEYSVTDSEPAETFRLLIESGENKTEIVFYRVTTRKAFYTINGEGKYYVTIDDLNNVKSKLTALAKGELITRDNK